MKNNPSLFLNNLYEKINDPTFGFVGGPIERLQVSNDELNNVNVLDELIYIELQKENLQQQFKLKFELLPGKNLF